MTTKLNSFILPDNVIEKMRDQLNKTIDTKEEYGFTLCTEHNRKTIIDRRHCKGNECKINISRECDKKEKFVGAYHTHPYNPSTMSAGDMISSCKYDVNCIGGEGDNKIRCFIRKTHLGPSEQISCSNKAKKYHEEMEKPLSKRFEHIMKEYDTIDSLADETKRLQMIKENDKKAIKYNKDVRGLGQKLADLTNEYFDTIDIK